jgi:GNAT superfamily N-acetyltransferase
MNLNDVTIRTDLRPGDLGYVVYRHGVLYSREYDYGLSFEMYVAEGIAEFYRNYDSERDRVWVCEHGEAIVGFLLLMHRDRAVAQLRYFYLEPEYRGVGLGKRLMELYMEFLVNRNYRTSYLWTTNELNAAASLYVRHGFLLTEEKESTIFGKPLLEQRYDLMIGD